MHKKSRVVTEWFNVNVTDAVQLLFGAVKMTCDKGIVEDRRFSEGGAETLYSPSVQPLHVNLGLVTLLK